MEKAELRKAIKQLHVQYKEKREELSCLAVEHALQCQQIKEAKVVMLFNALPDEVETRGLIAALLTQGKRVLLPVVNGEEMVAVEVNKGTNYHKGSYGIEEPSALPYNGKIDVVIVPGVAFDNKGNRLGRGKGYYDRFLKNKEVTKIGLCLPYQLVEKVPNEEHDIRMDDVITA